VVLRNVRLSMWAPSCLPGYHLPFFAAGAAGIFAEHGLQVELVDPLPGPDNVRRVAEGRADFCLTNVNYYLAASSNVTPRLGPLPARFVMVIQQRSTLAALVRADSGLITTSDIGGCRVAGTPPHLARCSTFNMPEFFAEVRALEVAPPVFVPVADHQTLNLATAAHGFARPLPERVYRQEPAAVGPPVVSPRIPVGAGATQS